MEYKPISGRDLPRFAGVKTFFRLPHVDMQEDYDVALVGVPFDGSLSYRPGARFAPTRVRELSALGRVFHWERQKNYTEHIKVADIGDCPIVPISVEKSYEAIENYFHKLCSLNKKFVSVGGDHSTTLPILRALSKQLKQPIALIHFDAHLDTYPAAWGCEYHHGSFLRHAIEEGAVDGSKTVQVGIRGPLAGKDDLDFVHRHKLTTTTVDDLRRSSIDTVVETIHKVVGKSPCYISFDVDCLDPAYAPGTGTPVVGGLTTYETQQILRGLKLPQLRGADVVEVSPQYDHADITSLAAVDVMFEYLQIYAAQ